VPRNFSETWASYMLAEQRALVTRTEGILAHALAQALPAESREELDRWAEEDQRMAKEGLVELMDEEGETYHRHIDDLGPLDVTDRLRAKRARCDWLGWRTDEREKWVETWRYKRHILTDEA
jgi:3-oxoacyl-ACP reductase-like protein